MAGAKLVTDQVLAGSAKAGLVRLSVAPVEGSLPIAVGENDPILSRVHAISDVTGLQGELTALSSHGHSVFTVSMAGFVPSPESATGRFLKDDGTWAAIIGGGGVHAASHLPGGGDTIPTASGTQAGLLSAADWTTFNGGSFPGFGTTAGTACEGNDARLSDARPASDVPVWAKASTKPSYTYSEVGACSSGDARLSDARPASDVSAWAKAATKPTYTAGEVGAQAALNGTGFVKIAGTTIAYDNSTYLTSNQTITLSGDASGSGSTTINVSIGTFAGSAKGLVPASAGGTTNFLRADGAWGAPSGLGPARTTATWTTGTLATGATETQDVTLAKTCRLYRITTTRPALIRLYSTAAARTADASRPPTTPPIQPSDCELQMTTETGALTVLLKEVSYANQDSPVSNAAYLSVTNLGGSGTIGVTLTYQDQEA